MQIRTRVNKKTGQTQYRVRYLWYEADGKRRDSETGWFSTPKEAQEEAEKLKFSKEYASKENQSIMNNVTLETAYVSFMEDLKKEAYRNTTDNTTSAVTRYQSARTVYKYYFPDKLKKLKTRDVKTSDFRLWMNHINDYTNNKGKELGGETVRKYRSTLSMFNNYLANKGYYIDRELDVMIDIALTRMKLKPKKSNKRTRYCPTIYDIGEICAQYALDGLEKFENFYWYTLFMVLFFTGMRSEEIIGLRWCCVHLEAKAPYIDIINAISERENKENVKKRMSQGIYHTKNNNSEREIPILSYYYDVLESYKLRMKEEFSIDDLGNYYVFPNINAKRKEDRLTDYQKQKNILRELNKACLMAEVQKTDVQMFRHACATWLVTDIDHGGMGFEESRARDYFGHTSDAMLRDVYAKLNKRQRANRTSETFKGLSKQHAISSNNKELEFDIELSEKVRDETKNIYDKFSYKSMRLRGEILKAISEGKKEYIYYAKDIFEINYLIEESKKEGNDLDKQINFILAKTEMDDVWAADEETD